MPEFFNRLLGKDAESRAEAVQVLANLDSASSIPKLIKALGDEAVEVRRAAASALEPHGRTGDGRAIAALTKALGDTDAEVRKFAAQSLGEFVQASAGSAESGMAKDALIKLLGQERDEGVIKSAVMALARIQDPTTVARMVEAFMQKDKKLVRVAIEGIDDLPSNDFRLDMKKGLRSIL
jgi:HEAT repeat protein